MRTGAAILLVLVIASAMVLGIVWVVQGTPLDRPETPPKPVAVSRDRPSVPRDMEIPWLRDVDDPRLAKVPVAASAWSARRPGRVRNSIDVALAPLPWVREITPAPSRVSVPLATLPWRAGRNP